MATDDSGPGIGRPSKHVVKLASSKFNLFGERTYEHGSKKRYEMSYRPQSVFTNTSPCTFYIEPDPEKFIESDSLKLHGKGRIMLWKDNAWVNLADEDVEYKVGPINNIWHSSFVSVIIAINDKEIGEISHYQYMALLKMLLGARDPVKETTLLSRGFVKDSAGHMDSCVTSAEGNSATVCNGGFIKRRKLFHRRKWVDFQIPLLHDLCAASTHLPPDTKLQITLRRASDDFCLIQDTTNTGQYKLELSDLSLSVVKYETAAEVLADYRKRVKLGHIPRFEYCSNQFKSYNKLQGSTDLSYYNLFYGKHLPEQLYIMMVKQSAYNGHKNQNPFNFETFNLSEASVVINGENFPSRPITYKANEDEVDAYFTFLENTGTSNSEMDSVDISQNEYYNGYFILAFDLAPTKDNRLYLYEPTQGSLSLRLKTSTPLTENITVLVMSSYSRVMSFIDDKAVTDELVV